MYKHNRRSLVRASGGEKSRINHTVITSIRHSIQNSPSPKKEAVNKKELAKISILFVWLLGIKDAMGSWLQRDGEDRRFETPLASLPFVQDISERY